MANPHGRQSPTSRHEALRSRRKRKTAATDENDFVRAFADALHDILRHERSARHAAA